MKLLIVSNMSHYLQNGQVFGWGPTVREIDYLATIFDEIRHIAFLHSQPAPESSLPYSSNRISFVPVKPSGGVGMRKKLGILSAAPAYISVMKEHLKWADLVHVRCAANISLMALLVLGLVKHPRYRWVKYAGNWSPNGCEPLSFTFQRWWLNRGLHRGIVTVNGVWHGQPPHVYSFLNPCLTEEELETARNLAKGKQLIHPYRFLYAGRVARNKGVDRALEIVARLYRKNISLRLDLAGDGEERPTFERMAKDLGLEDVVHFHGWMRRSELDFLYACSHFFLFPSQREGWPKVLSEAMAHGVVPIAGAVGSIPQVLKSCKTGIALPLDDADLFVDSIVDYFQNPAKWNGESENAVSAAALFTFEKYCRDLIVLFQTHWGLFQ